MKPFLKFGLIVGAIGLLVIVPVTTVVGICGPGVTLVAGAVAGFLSTYYGQAVTRKDGAQSGAISGAIAGAITLIGQVIGAFLALALIQKSGTQISFGQVPSSSAPAFEHLLYYGSGMATGLCFGVVGIVLGGLAGALTGSLGIRPAPPSLGTPASGQGM